MLRTTSISLAQKELRRDRRYAVPPVAVCVGAERYPAINWSLGGFLLERAPSIDVGAKLDGHLLLQGREDALAVQAMAVRRDATSGTLGCRFLDPDPALLDALDRAVAARFARRRSSAAGRMALAVLGAILAGVLPAKAADTGALVPGAAPLPEFRLNFPSLLVNPVGPPPVGDLSISVNSPDSGAIHFLFSPRSQFATVTDPESGASRSYAGLSWNVFDRNGFYGNLGVAGSLLRPGAEDQYSNWHYLGPSLALHSTFELGYELGEGHSLTLSLDRASEPSILSDRDQLGSFTLRYGLKF